MPGPVTGKRPRRWWLLLAGLAVIATAATGVTVVIVRVQHFLYGGVPLAYMGPGFGTGGWGATGSGSPWDTPVVSPDGRMLYVPSGTKTITPVDTVTRKAGPRIRLRGPGTVARMAVTPDSRTLFAAMLVESSTAPGLPLARVDLRTGRETGQIEVPGGAEDFVLSRDGKTLCVASEYRFIVDKNNNVTGEVHAALYAVSAATGRIERQLPVLPTLLDDAVDMVLSLDGGTLYLATAANSGQNAVTSVSLRTGEPGIDVGLEDVPAAMAITPDGRTLYVIVEGGREEGTSGQVVPSKVTAIDTATSTVRASLAWKVPPRYLTMAPDGKTVWVVSTTGEEETTADNTVTPVNTVTGQAGPSLRTSGWLNHQDPPSAATISPDSHTLYIAVRNGLETFRVSLPARTKSLTPVPAGTAAPARRLAAEEDPPAKSPQPAGPASHTHSTVHAYPLAMVCLESPRDRIRLMTCWFAGTSSVGGTGLEPVTCRL
jgi:DNA-binding beta-propeller fold protein YncE